MDDRMDDPGGQVDEEVVEYAITDGPGTLVDYGTLGIDAFAEFETGAFNEMPVGMTIFYSIVPTFNATTGR